MRFLADMGVDGRIVHWLRGQGHDAVLAHAASTLEQGAVVIVQDVRHRVRQMPIGVRCES